MDLLFRLGKKERGFQNIESARYFFTDTIFSRDKSHFHDVVNREKSLNDGDKIFFSFDSYIIAKGTFTGKVKINRDREKAKNKCVYGHKLKDIQLLDASKKINSKILGTRTTYIDAKRRKEIYRVLSSNTSIYPDEIPDDGVPIKEGTKKPVTVNIYERNPKARKLCLEKYGYVCSVCEFDFEKKYGDIGKNFIHVHHLKSLHEIGNAYEVNPIKDLRPVCPNCHAMLHRKNPCIFH